MNPGWRVLDFSEANGALSYRRGQVVISSEGKDDFCVPLAEVAVLLVGAGARLSGSLLSKLSEYDVAVMICDWRLCPIAAIYPWGDHSRIAARHRAQAALSEPRRKQAWARIVKAKILGQAETLHGFGSPAASILQALAKQVRSGDVDNCEAQAARRYWAALELAPGFTRKPHTGDDMINSCFDYAYMVLRSHGIRAVMSAGLSGPLGLFHRSRNNNFALVDDLIEPFRPAVDAFLLNNLENWDLQNRDTKRHLVGSTMQDFSAGVSLPDAMMNFAQHVGQYVEGDLKQLPVPTWTGVNDAGSR